MATRLIELNGLFTQLFANFFQSSYTHLSAQQLLNRPYQLVETLSEHEFNFFIVFFPLNGNLKFLISRLFLHFSIQRVFRIDLFCLFKCLECFVSHFLTVVFTQKMFLMKKIIFVRNESAIGRWGNADKLIVVNVRCSILLKGRENVGLAGAEDREGGDEGRNSVHQRSLQ